MLAYIRRAALILSFVGLTAIILIWWWSRIVPRSITLRSGNPIWYIYSDDAYLSLNRTEFQATPGWGYFIGGHLGFSSHLERNGDVSIWGTSAPHWFLCILTGFAPFIWICARLRRRWRVWRGLCWVCGYDLRFHQGKCPECGTGVTGVRKRGPEVGKREGYI
jgi:hypothetical protein